MVITMLIVSILLGALIGLQREYNQIHENITQFAGIRTFILISLLGATVTYLSKEVMGDYALVIIAFTMISLLAIVAYALEVFKLKDSGSTTEVSSILTFLVGVICGLNLIKEAVIFGIIIAAILTFKENIHKFAANVQKKELIAIVQFAIFSLIILPLLPNKEYSPLDVPILSEVLTSFGLTTSFLEQLTVFNPYHFWWMVLLVAGISFLGYILVKFLGTNRGYGLAGLVGGLISSTAVTLSMAQESKKSKRRINPFVVAVVVASATSFIRILIEVIVVNNSLLDIVLIPLILMSLVGYGIAFFIYLKEGSDKKAQTIEYEQPFSITTALKFGAFFVLIIFVTKIAQIVAGPAGLYLAGIISGLADVDAITLTMAKLSNLGDITNRVAATTIILALASNTLVKAGMAWMFGEKKFAKSILTIFIIILALGLLSLAIII